MGVSAGAEFRRIIIDGSDCIDYCRHYDKVALKEYQDHYKLYLGNAYIRIIKAGILEHWHTDDTDQFFCKQYDGIKLIRVAWDK